MAEREEAPANNLPDWSECSMRVENSDFLAKRVAEGGYGPEADSKLATELHRFIYEYDDADRYRSAWFLHRLELLLEETRRAALSASKQSETEPVAWECRKRLPNSPAWSEWTTCLERDHIAIQKNALHWGMVYQSRALCLATPPATAAQPKGDKSHE